jgi:hypothetical protein
MVYIRIGEIMKLKIIFILYYILLNSCYSQFRFTRSLPDPHYKLVFLGHNLSSNETSSKNGWGGTASTMGTPSTTVYKFGTHATLMSANGASVLYSNNSTFFDPLQYGNDFTIEMWFFSTDGTTAAILFQSGTVNPAAIRTMIWPTTYYFNILMGDATGTGNVFAINSSNNIYTTMTWHHFATVRKGDSIASYINGVQFHKTLSKINHAGYPGYGASFSFSGNSQQTFKGYMQAMKISTIARYTGNFTPPTKMY